MAAFEEFDSRFQYYMHGTNNEDVESFFNKGLISKYGCSMNSTLTPIDNEDIEEMGLRTIEQNYARQYNFKYCYLIKIPKYYMGWMVHSDDSIESPLPIWIPTNEKKSAYGELKILTPHLIAGVYSAERGQVMPNPNYNPKYDPTGMQYAKEQIEYMLLSGNALYQKWVQFAQARSRFGYDDLKRKDIAGNIWSEHLKRYTTLITEQYNPRPANLVKK